MGYRVFHDVNRIGRPKAVTSIPILLGHYGKLQGIIGNLIFIKKNNDFSFPYLEQL